MQKANTHVGICILCKERLILISNPHVGLLILNQDEHVTSTTLGTSLLFWTGSPPSWPNERVESSSLSSYQASPLERQKIYFRVVVYYKFIFVFGHAG